MIIVFITIVIDLHGQTLDSITHKFNTFRNRTFTEKIFLHTDRSSFFTGESIWFTIYHMDATFHKPLDWSKIVYVEVLGPDRTAVLQGKFMLTNGYTTGTLFLPASLNTGHYEIRAYTSWMKNFDASGFFHQTITIINPFRDLEKVSVVNPSYDIQFFPEGGHLVSGLESKVGVRVVGQDGHGIRFKGAVLNHQNDTVAKFVPLKFGLGSFIFTPLPNHTYRAVIRDSDNKSVFYPIPPAKTEGLVMRLTELNSKLKVTVRSTDVNEKRVYLLAHTRLASMVTAEQVFKNGETEFIIDKSALGEGISHITIFNEQLQPVCERLWFKKPEKKLAIKSNLNRSEFSTRHKIDLSILMDTAGRDRWATMSVVVYKTDSLDLPVDNVAEYLGLTSELRGKVENPAYYFGPESPELREASNNLMLTHGWRRYKWDEILSTRDEMRSAPELRGHIISGKMINSSTGKPEENVAAYLAFPEGPVNVYVSRSDSSGRIAFEVNASAGKNLILQADTRKGGRYQFEVNDPFYKVPSSYSLPAFSLRNSDQGLVKQRSLHMQVYNLFYKDKFRGSAALKDATFYGKPDERYLLDDYTRFPTLEEVMREYVPGVRVLKSKDQFRLSNVDIINNGYFHDEPLVLIDGVPVFDMNTLMNVDPLKIKRLDAITKRYYLQAASFDGIVSLTSYDRDLGGFQLPIDALVTAYSAMEESLEFFSPRYETESQRLSSVPDVRYILHRSANALAKQIPISFYTSDVTGEFRVVVQALSSQGVPGYYSTTFHVK